MPEHKALFFTDTIADTIYKWTADDGCVPHVLAAGGACGSWKNLLCVLNLTNTILRVDLVLQTQQQPASPDISWAAGICICIGGCCRDRQKDSSIVTHHVFDTCVVWREGGRLYCTV
jgi:hypothetical protein